MTFSLIRTDKNNTIHLSTKTAEAFIQRIQTDTQARDIIRLREHLSRGNELRYYAPLEQLPQVYPSAELTKEKNGALRMVAFNGLVSLHVGGQLQADEIEAVKAAAQSLPMTFAAFAGGDGQSVEILVKVCTMNGTLPQDEEDADAFCRAAYSRACAVYSAVLPKDVDSQSWTLMSHFLMPLDPVPYYNADAVPLRIPLSSPALSPVPPLPTLNAPTDSPLASATRQLIDFLDAHYAFRHNTIMGYTEYRSRSASEEDWKPCDENAVNGLTIETRLAGLNTRDKDVRRYVNSDRIPPYNPLAEYLGGLYGKWDGQDHIGLLAGTVPCDVPQFPRWFRMWFIYMVAQGMGRLRTYGNSTVLLLVSPQGDNKSTFCRRLVPDHLQWAYCDNLLLSEKKQVLQAMHQFLLINLDEFNQISPGIQEGFLKNLVQLPSVKIKRPYGRHVEVFPRRASFIGTANEMNLLSDPTGSRRFIILPLKGSIDVSYRINYDQLYTQAVTAVLNHERYWFDETDVHEIIAYNRQYTLTPPAIEYFNEYFEPTLDESEGHWMTTTAIYEYLRHRVGSTLPANGINRFGRFLAHNPLLLHRHTSHGNEHLVKEK